MDVVGWVVEELGYSFIGRKLFGPNFDKKGQPHRTRNIMISGFISIGLSVIAMMVAWNLFGGSEPYFN